ncbi:MAG TPA: 5-methyltetrahydropteroyltriglutamate--homocysteine S-methyltransferase [Pirellulaceae bacterium]|jgi:5-methyltetrahydropteroyltriglutamate--homocysteine methyltransferase|nr:5-methyltetrahydropteroyltriglutamate--homocysteine S-methyltransferase [Pirellulaceae bacterium]
MISTHVLGFPRIGAFREHKRALERYWKGESSLAELADVQRQIRAFGWQAQKDAGLDLLTVGDFAAYDHVLTLARRLGAVPRRFRTTDVTEDVEFLMARGKAPTGQPTHALEMTKWFDTNYHYLRPEFDRSTTFSALDRSLDSEVLEAKAFDRSLKVVLVGPVTLLALGRWLESEGSPLELLPALLEAYAATLARLKSLGVACVQLDEPILATDLSDEWIDAVRTAYGRLGDAGPPILLATYFARTNDRRLLFRELPVAGIHLDLCRDAEAWEWAAEAIRDDQYLSAGVVDGRSIWRTALDETHRRLKPLYAKLGDRLKLATSCSLLHVPYDAAVETEGPPALRGRLAFALQKLDELRLLKRSLELGEAAVRTELSEERESRAAWQREPGVLTASVRRRAAAVDRAMTERAEPYPSRAEQQAGRLNLPPLPTTTIGSFPQTDAIRAARKRFIDGQLSPEGYERAIESEIAFAIRKQEEYGLDVLVHGEPERNDMVEYFAEGLGGFAFTRFGWVQSYGSRCVKPPIIWGDVDRPQDLTVRWAKYAQSLTNAPVKGMLTGPVTILQWSFVRDDLSRADVARQIALALRDEVVALEAAGIAIVQVDEPAFREGLPLRQEDRASYLAWAAESFRLATAGVRSETQIHTHMCYSDFGDIRDGIVALDADVITLEAARSHDELACEFGSAGGYPREIGPGMYDIHSPNAPTLEEVEQRIDSALSAFPIERLWINPDCGLKTRTWSEVDAALPVLTLAAKQARERLATTA